MPRTYRFFLSVPSHVSFLSAKRDFVLDEKMEPEIFFQLIKVLRAKPGDRVTLLASKSLPIHDPSDALTYEYEISSAEKKSIALSYLRSQTVTSELPLSLHLVLCLPNKPDKLELILQKSVELGVSGVTLVQSDFSQMKHALRLERLEKIMQEAAEQSERSGIPKVTISGKLVDWLDKKRGSSDDILVAMERLSEHEFCFSSVDLLKFLEHFPSHGSRDVQGSNAQESRSPGTSPVQDPAGAFLTLLVGPEGGFSPLEKQKIQDGEFPCFSLGKRILRMETAAIVSLGIVSTTLQTT